VNRMRYILPLLLLLAAPALAQERRAVDRVAAVVNGDVITLSELVERSGADYRRASEMPPGEARERARAKALRNAFDLVVAERLLEAEGATAGWRSPRPRSTAPSRT
jgi:peptidyl-prolyl cis-trans isomerase SurA